jgi:hypothetical protein
MTGDRETSARQVKPFRRVLLSVLVVQALSLLALWLLQLKYHR